MKLVVVALLLAPLRVLACATCGCGDPTLTASGVEKPYANRLRLTLSERLGSSQNGAGTAEQSVLTSRTQLALSYTPIARLTLVAFLPFVDSELRGPGKATAHVAGLGDLELQARVVVARDRSFAPHHLLWLVGGLKMPTGPRLYDDLGYAYDDDDQPGSGSWDPLGGATYAWFGGLVSAYSSLVFRYPTTGPRGYRFGPTLFSSSIAQLQPFSWLALQLGLDIRDSWADKLSNGADSPNTGGFLTSIVPGALVNPWGDLLVRVAVEIPIVQVLNGTQAVSPQLVVAVSYDVL